MPYRTQPSGAWCLSPGEVLAEAVRLFWHAHKDCEASARSSAESLAVPPAALPCIVTVLKENTATRGWDKSEWLASKAEWDQPSNSTTCTVS